MFKKLSFILLFFIITVISTYSQYVQVVNSSNWSKIEYGNRDTTNATADTLSRQIDLADTSKTLADKFKQWWQCWFTTDDTIQISSSASFPANDITIILPCETWTSQPNDVAYRTNYYWKILGTGTAYVRKRVWGI
jgi:hypothetical protein